MLALSTPSVALGHAVQRICAASRSLIGSFQKDLTFTEADMNDQYWECLKAGALMGLPWWPLARVGRSATSAGK